MAGITVDLDAVELGKQLDKVKTGQTRWFGFVKGSTPKECYLELSKTEGQITRSMMAAKKGRTTVVATGEVTYDGGVFKFKSVKGDNSVGTVMRKQLKEGLSKVDELGKHKQRIKQAEIDGEVVDPDAPKGDPDEEEDGLDLKAAWLKASGAARDVHGKLKETFGTEHADFKRIEALRVDGFATKKAGDYAGGIALMEQLVEGAKALLARGLEPEVDEGAWDKAASAAKSLYPQLKSGLPPELFNQLEQLRKAGVDAKKKGSLGEAVAKMNQFVEDGRSALASEPDTATDRLVQKREDLWQKLLGQAKDAYKAGAKALGTSSGEFQQLEAMRAGAVEMKKKGDLEEATFVMQDYLGKTKVALANAGEPVSIKEASSSWQDAVDEVNEQINNLSSILKQSPKEALRRIGDAGLNGIVESGGLKVPLMARLMELRSVKGDARTKAMTEALELSKKFADLLKTDARFEAIDRNPWGIQANVRDTIGAALTRLDRSIQAEMR